MHTSQKRYADRKERKEADMKEYMVYNFTYGKFYNM